MDWVHYISPCTCESSRIQGSEGSCSHSAGGLTRGPLLSDCRQVGGQAVSLTSHPVLPHLPTITQWFLSSWVDCIYSASNPNLIYLPNSQLASLPLFSLLTVQSPPKFCSITLFPPLQNGKPLPSHDITYYLCLPSPSHLPSFTFFPARQDFLSTRVLFLLNPFIHSLAKSLSVHLCSTVNMSASHSCC